MGAYYHIETLADVVAVIDQIKKDTDKNLEDIPVVVSKDDEGNSFTKGIDLGSEPGSATLDRGGVIKGPFAIIYPSGPYLEF